MTQSAIVPLLSTANRHVGPRPIRSLVACWVVVLLILGALLPNAPAHAADPAVVAKSGSGEIVACASCHGAAGEGMASFPRLAGMNAAYLLHQMESIAVGTRESPVMKPIVDALGAQGRREMADYYGSLPVAAAGGEIPAPTSPGGHLALRGEWDRNIPACVQCHGPRGTGVGQHFPAIAGQPAPYIVAQLKAWKDGTRKNDPLELMRHLSAKLSDKEMRDVASWFSGQSPSAALAKESR
ncbi:MAG: c-type cytochrome [Lysobacter sp.]